MFNMGENGLLKRTGSGVGELTITKIQENVNATSQMQWDLATPTDSLQEDFQNNLNFLDGESL